MCQRGLDILHRLNDQLPQRAVVDDQNPMLVKPLLEVVQRRAAILPAGQSLLEPAHHVAALMLGHRPKPERLVGQLLVVGERVGPIVVQRAQGAEIRRLDAELFAQMVPESLRNLFVSIERAPGHADEPEMQSDSQPVQMRASAVDQRAFPRREREERMELELGQLVRKVPHAEVGLPPVIHRTHLRAKNGLCSVAGKHRRCNRRRQTRWCRSGVAILPPASLPAIMTMGTFRLQA
ncbi:hypothetical protein VL15_14870 [Burkholderia cepacia]|uniref:Uncharacterized protein n=1 Tax=Burkholderia cepacia TaxID=292 RepID=A0A0J5WYU2_BURCE|nr:hypothetical protein VL15_14870 [Burkholderia cepacia]